MRRLFVPEGCVGRDLVRLCGPEAHYLRDVLRLAPGGVFLAVLPDGTERAATVVRLDEGHVEAALGEALEPRADPQADLRLRPALVKGRKLDLVIQKCTELGVAEIAPVLCDRSVSRPDPDGSAHKLERWRKIALEAARQCGRTSPPRIAPPRPFGAAVAEVGALGGAGLILAPEQAGGIGAQCPILTASDREPVSVLVGPEGGFTAEEVTSAREAGLRPVGLGARILRAETAAIAISALLVYELGELL